MDSRAGLRGPDPRKQPVKYLWFVGDFASFDERLQETSRILARILHDAGVDFGLLFEAERNAGNDVRRVGEEGLYEVLSEHNAEVLREAQFDEIFTTDPHTLNALTQRIPRTGGELPGLALHRATGQVVGGGCDQGQALGPPGHLPRPLLPCPLQRGGGSASTDSAGARLRARRDAP